MNRHNGQPVHHAHPGKSRPEHTLSDSRPADKRPVPIKRIGAVSLPMVNRSLVRKVIVSLGGVLLMALGTVGVVLPIMPGFVFFIAGLIVLSHEFAWADRALTRARAWVAGRRARSGDRPMPSGEEDVAPRSEPVDQ